MMRTREMLLVGAAGVVALGLSLSGGCKKPPSPPPPPPPPPPPVVILDDVAKEMPNLDPRVSWKSDIQVTDRAFIVSALTLADAFARGDAAKAKSLMDAQGQGVVDELVNSAQWDDASKTVEAVRIVFAAPPGEMSDLERDRAIEALTAQVEKDVARIFEIALQGGQTFESAQRLADAAKARLQSQLADIKSGQQRGLGIDNPLDTIFFTNQIEAEGPKDRLEDIKGIGEKPAFVMLMAVQTPTGADLLGWTVKRAGDGFVYRAASTLPFSYSRASDWDSTGMFGFSLNLGKVLPPEQGPEQVAPDAPAPSAPDAPSGAPPSMPPSPGGPRGPRAPGG